MLYATADLSNAAERWRQAFAERSAEALAVLFAERAWALYPQARPILGRAAIRQMWSRYFARPDFTHAVTVDEVVESEQGDLGYVFGCWWQCQPSARLKQGGRYVAIWQPRHGAWEVTHLSANALSDIAATELEG